MAKKQTTPQVSDHETIKDWPQAASTATAEKGKAGGRLIGSWFADAVKQGGTDEEIAARINAMADEASKDYHATAEKVADYRAKQSGEARPKAARGRPAADQAGLFNAPKEPTLTDLLTVKEAGATLDAETIKTVADLAGRVGGLDNLRRCLEALEKLGG